MFVAGVVTGGLGVFLVLVGIGAYIDAKMRRGMKAYLDHEEVRPSPHDR